MLYTTILETFILATHFLVRIMDAALHLYFHIN